MVNMPWCWMVLGYYEVVKIDMILSDTGNSVLFCCRGYQSM